MDDTRKREIRYRQLCLISVERLEIIKKELSPEERYNIWFNNNYETGMERLFDPNDIPNFEDEYYEPTPKKVTIINYKCKISKIFD